MGLKICSLASGSTGNCIYVASDTTKILVDVGISVSRVGRALACLRTDCEHTAVLVTHCHSDHISCVPAFTKKYPSVKTYAHYRTLGALSENNAVAAAQLTEFGDDDFYIGDITVSPFAVSHDVPCMGFSFLWQGKKISIATDLGYIDENVLARLGDSDLVLLESNHDEELLKVNDKYGPWLKKRILGPRGHLSNEACAQAAVRLAANGVGQLLLGHLSQENNYPELAYTTIRSRLNEAGYDEASVKVEVARADRLSGLFEVV